MRTKMAVAMLVGIALSPATARETHPGQYDHVPADVQQWFKEQRSPQGTPCCDIGDGLNTASELRNGHWWVPSKEDANEWIMVPDSQIIYNHGNPNGNAVVWFSYDTQDGHALIRCFVIGALM